MNVQQLQARLSVKADGTFGPISATALFVACGARDSIATSLGQGAAQHFERYELLSGSGLRLAHFLAQTGHESGGFRYMQELGSPAYFARYEGRRDLGNVKPGDGARFFGRGPIQITGRANYRLYGQALGLPLEDSPEIASHPEIGILIACEFWRMRSLNAYADRDDLRTITRRINGGENGLSDRQARLVAAKRLVL